MKAKADEHRRSVEFEEGDLVLVYLGKGRLASATNSKLRPRKYGPFRILKKLNPNAYRLELPLWMGKMSPSFNVKDLSAYKEDGPLPLGVNSSKEGENDGDISPALGKPVSAMLSENPIG